MSQFGVTEQNGEYDWKSNNKIDEAFIDFGLFPWKILL